LVLAVQVAVVARANRERDDLRAELGEVRSAERDASERISQLEQQLAEAQLRVLAAEEEKARALAAATSTTTTAAPPASATPPGFPGPKQVALTFDDGPNPPATLQLLDVLDQLDAKATFFVLGQYAERHPDVIREADRRGHGIASHSWGHPDLTKVSDEQLRNQEIGRTNEVLSSIIGRPITCMRPPQGRTDDRVRAAIEQAGMIQLKWNVDPSDYLRMSPEELADRVVTATTRLGDKGAVVVLHDGGDNSEVTIAAVKLVVERLRPQGYTFVPLCR
jgi:peptidoglycan/xylan/chitin deacetylase (PgdA/CDA1 family)